MTIRELNRDQLIQVKQRYLVEHLDGCSYGEMAAADEIVSDETIFNEYAGIEFVEDDFID